MRDLSIFNLYLGVMFRVTLLFKRFMRHLTSWFMRYLPPWFMRYLTFPLYLSVFPSWFFLSSASAAPVPKLTYFLINFTDSSISTDFLTNFTEPSFSLPNFPALFTQFDWVFHCIWGVLSVYPLKKERYLPLRALREREWDESPISVKKSQFLHKKSQFWPQKGDFKPFCVQFERSMRDCETLEGCQKSVWACWTPFKCGIPVTFMCYLDWDISENGIFFALYCVS